MVKMAVGDDMEISDGDDDTAREGWENCDVCGINFSSEKVTICIIVNFEFGTVINKYVTDKL